MVFSIFVFVPLFYYTASNANIIIRIQFMNNIHKILPNETQYSCTIKLFKYIYGILFHIARIFTIQIHSRIENIIYYIRTYKNKTR